MLLKYLCIVVDSVKKSKITAQQFPHFLFNCIHLKFFSVFKHLGPVFVVQFLRQCWQQP